MTDIRRLAAAALAERLSAHPGCISLLGEMFGDGAGRGPAGSAQIALPDDAPIGPWHFEAGESGGEYVKRDPDPYQQWADVARIARRKRPGVRRICLVGESVAAGDVYHPAYTPAKLLAAMLAAPSTATAFEVIDLSQIAMDGPTLEHTVAACTQLDPERIVVFAGNNWPQAEISAVARALWSEHGSLEDEVAATGAASAAAHRGIVDYLVYVARETGIPLTLVVPDTNLGDYAAGAPPRDATAAAAARWSRHRERAEAALAAGALGSARVEIAAMEEIEPTATTAHLVGQLHLAEGRRAEAEAAFRREVLLRSARDEFPRVNRIAPYTQQVLRDAAEVGLVDVLDCEALLREPGGPEPRAMWTDNCHLSVAGMKRVTAELAVRLLAGAGDERRSRAELERDAPDPSRAVDARAKLQIGLFNAQGNLSLHHRRYAMEWLERAREADPRAEEALVDYLDAVSGVWDAALTGAGRRNWTSDLRFKPYNFHRGSTAVFLVLEVLERWGVPVPDRVMARLCNQYGPGAAPVYGLLDEIGRPKMPSSSDMLLIPKTDRTLGYFRARSPETELRYLDDHTRALELRLTCRAPRSAEQQGHVAVELDGLEIGRVPVSDRWSAATLSVPATGVGLRRRLRLAWPVAQGGSDEVGPMFGDLFQLTLAATGS